MTQPFVKTTHGDNAIQTLLNTAGVPWRLPRRELVARYGIKRHLADHSAIIEIPTSSPLVSNLIWPLSAQAATGFAPHLPATAFSGATFVTEDSRDNLRRTAVELDPTLGRARIVERYNKVRCEWTAGAASLRLTVWPLDLQDGPPSSNDFYKREPRLITACHVDIDTGFRLPTTDVERSWIQAFRSASPIQSTGNRGSEFDLEYTRECLAGYNAVAGCVGTSAGGEALIFAQSQLYVVPMIDVIDFEVIRMTPAKGGGGSWLHVNCRTQCEGLRHKSLPISQAPGADDLNELASTLGELTRRPYRLGEYAPDC